MNLKQINKLSIEEMQEFTNNSSNGELTKLIMKLEYINRRLTKKEEKFLDYCCVAINNLVWSEN